MKKSVFLLLGLLCFYFTSIAQDGVPLETVPEKVQQGLDTKYSGEKLIFNWRKVGNLYIAVFQHNGGFKYCALDDTGFWQEQGLQVSQEEIPENVMFAIPKLDITAFVVEVFRSSNRNDDEGFTFLYETDTDRIEIFITNEGKVIRQNKYPIPEEKDEEEEGGADDGDWK